MKKLINLIALVMLVSVNVLAPFSYAQVETSELIPGSELETVDESFGESGETPEINEETSEVSEEIPEANSEEKGELEQGSQDDETPEDILPNVQDDVETPSTDETEEEDTESDEVVQPVEEISENEIQDEEEKIEELEKVEESVVMDVIPNTSVMLLPGQEFNSVIKTLANGGTYVAYTGVDNNIQSFQRVDVDPAGVTTGEISVAGSEYPVHAWFSGGVLYYSTKAEIIQLNENSQNMFQGFSGLTGLDLSNFDTSNVTNMNSMFSGCVNVEYLNLDNWNLSNISNYNMVGFKSGTPLLKKISMRGWKIPEVFQGKVGRTWGGANNLLEEIDVTNWDLTNVKDLRGLFAGATSLKTIKGLETWDTSKVTDMGQMFYQCNNLEEINVSTWNTSKVTNMYEMFRDCDKLEKLDLRHFDVSNVTNMGEMFQDCNNLKILNLESRDVGSVVTIRNIIHYCNNLEELNLSGWDFRNIGGERLFTSNLSSYQLSKVKKLNLTNTKFSGSMERAFSGIPNVEEIKFDGIDTSNVTKMSYMFESCKKLENLDLSILNTSNVTGMDHMFKDCTGLVNLNLSGWDFRKVGSYSLINRISLWSSPLKTLNMTNAKFSGSMQQAFQGLGSKNVNLVLDNIDTSNVTSMNQMFQGCEGLTGLNISGWDTRNVTDMSLMFQFCSGLHSLDLNSLDVSKVTNMYGMFYGCSGLANLDINNLNTSNVTSMGAMFNGCSNLIGLDLSNFDTSNVTNMGGIFVGCNKLEEINLSGWDFRNYSNNAMMMNIMGGTPQSLKKLNMTNTKYTGNATYAFGGLDKLEELNLNGADTRGVTNMTAMFNGDSKLKDLDLSSFDTSNVTNMSQMFYGCSSLTGLDLSNWDTSNVTNMGQIFYGCSNLTGLDLSNFDTSNVINMGFGNGGIFGGCNKLEELNLSGWNFKNVSNIHLMMYVMGGTPQSLKKLNMTNTKYTGNATYAFGGLDKLEKIDLEGVDTRGVTNMSQMFKGCSSLTGLDLSNWDTSNVTDVSQMFAACSNLEKINLNNWNTDKLESFGQIFGGCGNLEEISLSGWDFRKFNVGSLLSSQLGLGVGGPLKKLDITNTKFSGNMEYSLGGQLNLEEIKLDGIDTSNVTSMRQLFFNSFNLKSINLSSFDTSKVEIMEQMFSECRMITGLDLSSFDTRNVTNMQGMFDGCSGLNELDLSNFDTKNVTRMLEMFRYTPNLKTIYASDKFIISSLTDLGAEMFYKTTSVVGGNGTKFDPNFIDKTYALIDKVGQTGYFTDKNAINVKFINTLDGTETLATFAKGQKLTPPFVDKYHVVGGYLDEAMTQQINLNNGVDSYSEIYVKYERNGSSGGGGGGGGSTKPDTPKDEQQPAEPSQSDASSGTNVKEPETNTGSNIQTGSQVDPSEQTTQNDESNTQDSPTSSQDDGKTYSTEFQEAYEFAKGNGITTMPTIQKANMEGKLTRIAMAKMLSQYAINVLGKTPDTSKTVKFKDVSNKKDADYDNGVTLAYQLGIMGQNMPGNNFRPNDEVTRAEFATALSRMAYNTSDGEYKSTSKYYIHHMEKLVNEGIITNDNPNMKELRGYVMIMLMRSAK